MIINSPRAFRKLVIDAEKRFNSASVGGLLSLILAIGRFTKSDDATFKLWYLIERIIQNRSGYLTFEQAEEEKKDPWLALAIERQRMRNQIRKQEEAPEVKTKGAESSLELCDSCKNTFKSDHDVCPDCALMGFEKVCEKCGCDLIYPDGPLCMPSDIEG